MDDSKDQYDNEQSSGRTSQDSVMGEEKAGLLGPDRFNSSSSISLSRHRWQLRASKLWAVIALLVLSNVVILVILVQNIQRHHRPSRPTWLPPEKYVEQIFTFQELYGLPPSKESTAAWDKLMPIGRGFVYINNDTVLPDQPRLDQSIKHQKGMVSVFHQLHCLAMAREGYYGALAGNIDTIEPRHLYHCWDYLRQAIMCFSDTTIEWIPAPPNDIGSTGWGYRHKCRNFKTISQWATDNKLKWSEGIH